MIPGCNHNIKHNGKIYHVQTEDNGINNPYIMTHVFLGGNIIATRKSNYLDIAGNENSESVIKTMMQEQHKAVIKELINGAFDDAGVTKKKPQLAEVSKPESVPQDSDAAQNAVTIDADKAKEEEEKSLDEIILEYLAKESK